MQNGWKRRFQNIVRTGSHTSGSSSWICCDKRSAFMCIQVTYCIISSPKKKNVAETLWALVFCLLETPKSNAFACHANALPMIFTNGNVARMAAAKTIVKIQAMLRNDVNICQCWAHTMILWTDDPPTAWPNDETVATAMIMLWKNNGHIALAIMMVWKQWLNMMLWSWWQERSEQP